MAGEAQMRPIYAPVPRSCPDESIYIGAFYGDQNKASYTKMPLCPSIFLLKRRRRRKKEERKKLYCIGKSSGHRGIGANKD
jgi:hypothetical protein